MKKLRNWLVVLAATAFVSTGLFSAPAGEPAQAKDKIDGVQHVDPKQAQKLIADKTVIVLDIRTPGEFQKGHIAGAKNIDFQASDFEKRIDSLDKSKTYLVHCASGGRSTRCLPVLAKHEFQSVYHLDGGIKAWEKDGLPVEK